MSRHDTTMMGLYLVVIALGAMVAERDFIPGIIQICGGAFFFALRLQRILGTR
jgi:hypothetical protein